MCLAAPGGASGDTGVIGGEGVPTEEGVSGGLKAHSSHPPISGAPEVQVIYIKRAFVMNLGQCMQELCGLFISPDFNIFHSNFIPAWCNLHFIPSSLL